VNETTLKPYTVRGLRAALAAGTLLAALASAPAALAQAATETLQPLDQVVAIVDEDVILASELRSALLRAQANVQRSGREIPAEQLQRQVFDQLVLESLQLQLAERAGVRIADAELNEAIGRIAEQNGMTLEQFSQALGRDGLSYNAAREQLRKEMVLQRVQQGFVSQRVQITDQEIEGFLRSPEGQALAAPQYHLRHVLVPLSEESDAAAAADARTRAEQVATRLRGGEALAGVLESKGPEPLQGGDLGWRRPDDLPSLFADLVPGLNPGQVADPVRSPSGFHVLQLVETRGTGEVIQQTKARHILLKASAIRSEEQTQALAAELRQRALGGADFGDLARRYSEDIGSAMEGGDLGWTSPGQLVGEFQTAMDNTAKAAISEPFRSQYGWHILQVEERRQQDVTDTIRRNMARNYLHQRKFQDELDAWLHKIRDEAYVDIKKL
jgi:peptidyl-prolyl cis-trans isomerase SurA